MYPKTSVMVTGITLDSRNVRPGYLYVALPGSRIHGASYASQALERGAAAVLTDPQGGKIIGQLTVPVLIAENVRFVAAVLAARLFDNPAAKMTMFGLTGTNGKTTTSFLLAAALGTNGVATIGTIGFRLGDETLEATRTTVTTPESPDLQALLAYLVERGAAAAALEVSSHALALNRVAGIHFDYAGFINLGHDHLDFHHTQDAYFEAKAALFTSEYCDVAVINIADPAGKLIAEQIRHGDAPQLITYGSFEADYYLTDFKHLDPLHTSAIIHAPSGKYELNLAMPGRYNAEDALLAFALAEQAGRPAKDALAGISKAQVPGRMQVVDLGSEAPLVVVDFAHTPQAVTAALESFQEYRPVRRVITLIGAGGDRDKDKRGPMGAAAAKLSDIVIVTDDNPRTESPACIRAAIVKGAMGHADIHEIDGRAAGIRTALEMAHPGDIIAILGKGHEQGQILADRMIEFDDATVTRKAWLGSREER